MNWLKQMLMLTLLSVMAFSCGQKGPLYIQEQSKALPANENQSPESPLNPEDQSDKQGNFSE